MAVQTIHMAFCEAVLFSKKAHYIKIRAPLEKGGKYKVLALALKEFQAVCS